ncbi:MAG TPA: glycosyltransferase family 1 protein [Bacteroidota bacterium]
MIAVDVSVLEHEATGIAKSTLGLYAACKKLQPDLDLVGIHRDGLKSNTDGVLRDVKVGHVLPRKLWRTLAVPSFCFRSKPEYVHFPWNGRVAPATFGATTITTIHDVLPLSMPNYFSAEEEESRYRSKLRRDISRAAILITDSEYSRSQIKKEFDILHEPVVIPLATSWKFRGGRDVSAQDYFVYVGGYAERKGLEILLETFLEGRKLNQLSSSLYLTGKPRFISDRFAGLLRQSIEAGIVFEKGYVEDDELAEIVAGAKALVYLSLYEGFGLPPLEAMTVGCPVVTTRGTSLPEVCGDAVIYVDPSDRRSVIAALREIEQNQSLREDLKAKGLERSTVFSWTKSAQMFLSLLNRKGRSRQRNE